MNIDRMVPWKRDRARAERDPFAVLRREMDSLFDDFSSGGVDRLEGFSPQVDLRDKGKDIHVTAELPGLDEKDVEVLLSGDTLTIRGEKNEEKEDQGEERYRLERTYGAFRRSFSLPCEVDPDKATASYKKGVLTITLPKTAAAASKRIGVKAA